MGWADVQHPSHPPPQEVRGDGKKIEPTEGETGKTERFEI